jgi:bile acid:Na+ symporter, BASS family
VLAFTLNQKNLYGLLTMINRLNHTLHQYFLGVLLLAHAVGYYLPAFGQWIRHVQLSHITWLDGSTLQVTVPVLLLSTLLFNAGLGVQTSELKTVAQKPLVLLLGLAGNLLAPIAFGILVFAFSRHWHSAQEIQQILMGLAIVASMPIAGSSTAWAQNGNGNLALSLGLVVFSTLLSPFLTPFVLHGFGWLTMGDYSSDLHELATTGAGAFLSLSVVLPSLAGIGLKMLTGNTLNRLKPYLKLVNTVCLLTLIYSNAALVLPQTFIRPDWDFLLLIMLITSLLCISAFTLGWIIAKVLKTSDSEKTSLMYGLGMNNNGTGLVLSSLSLADHPAIMLPIVFYNLTQQIVAGVVDKWQNKA